MDALSSVGRTLLIVGSVLVGLGLIVLLAGRFPGLRIGRLPGDLRFTRGNFSVYVPLATSIALSVLLSLVFWLFRR